MSNLPFLVTSTQTSAFSPRARALAAHLDQALAAYRAEHPELRDAEVLQAVHLIRTPTRSHGVEQRRWIVLVALLLVAGLFLVGAYVMGY